MDVIGIVISNPSNPTSSKNNNWVRMFDVGDPRRHKKGFTVYKVTSKVFPKGDPGGLTVLTVWKRYNDFKKLHLEMEKIHRELYLRGKFPQFPKGNSFHRFEYEVIEERKKAATSLLHFVGNHVQLFTTKIFNQFFENGYDPKDFSPNATTTNAHNDLKPQADATLSECLTPEIVWRLSPKSGDEDGISCITSITSDDGISSTESDSALSGSIFSSASKSCPSCSPSSGPLPKSQSQFLMPTFLADSTSRNGHSDIEVVGVSGQEDSLQKLDNVPLLEQAEAIPSPAQTEKSGFLDFLPKFPNCSKSSKVSEETSLSESLSSSYICEAAGHFAVAQDSESNGKYQQAFSSYKEGIRILLAGVQSDEEGKRKILVKKKLEKYLAHAESIHDQILSSKKHRGTFSTFQLELRLRDKNSQAECPTKGVPYLLPSSLDELNEYKIVRIINHKIYLVTKMSQTVESHSYILKVFPFSAEPADPHKKMVLPHNIPFMAKLYKWFETDSCYIVLVQYAGGGKLIDYISSYEQKQNTSQLMSQELSSATSQNQEFEQLEQETLNFKCGIKSNVLQVIIQNLNTREAPHIETAIFRSTKMDSVQKLENNVPASVVKSQNFSDKENCDLEPYPQFTDNPSVDDLIACSKGLINMVTKTLAKENRNTSLAGEFLSKSLEDVSLSLPSTSRANLTQGSQAIAHAICSAAQFDPKREILTLVPQLDLEADEVPARIRSVPEGCLKGWAAEIVICLQKFHSLGLIYGDLAMDNILLGENGHVLLSFKAQWPNVDQSISPVTINEYTAPEVIQSAGECSWTIHPSCDFWSVGAILFQLFTGQNVHNVHHEGFHVQTVIRIPSTNQLGQPISSHVRSLLTELLEVNPCIRLGFYGAEEIKAHPCFEGFDWEVASAPLEGI